MREVSETGEGWIFASRAWIECSQARLIAWLVPCLDIIMIV